MFLELVPFILYFMNILFMFYKIYLFNNAY